MYITYRMPSLPTSKSIWSFSPQSIPGLALWLDAADTVTVTGTSPVTVWKDKSGKGNNATNSGGDGPTYADNTMTFSGYNSRLYISIPYNYAISGGTIVFVGKPLSYSVWNSWRTLIRGLNSDHHVILYSTNNDIGSYTLGNGFQQFGTYTNDGSFTMLMFVNISTSSLFSASMNGDIALSSNANPTLNTADTYYGLGNYNEGSQPWGDLNEIIIYDSALSTVQRQQLEGYLAQKWELQENLPTTHPYYATSALQLYKRPVFQRTFQPVDIDGCSLWLDAADSSTITGTSTVTAWADKSGNGYSFTKASYSGGTITLSSRNGNSTVNLGSNVMTTSSFPWTRWNTMFFVVSTTEWIYAVGDLANYFSTGNWQLLANGQNFQDANISQGTNLLPTLGLTNQYCLLVIGYGGGTQASNYTVNGTVRFTTAGTSTGNGTINPGSALSQSTTTAALWLNGGQFFNYGNGTLVAEIVHYNNELTTSQRQQVESYLAWKWGLVTDLTIGHPGKLLPSFSTVFTPKSLTGLQLWLDAVDLTSLSYSGSNVTAWADKSGNGNNATATGSPTLVQNSINGVQSIATDNGNYFNGSISITGTSFTCFAVATTSSPMPLTGSDQRLVSLANGTNTDYGETGGAIALFNQSGTNTIATYRVYTTRASNPIIQNTPFLAVGQNDGTNAYLWFNGSAGTLPSSESSGTFEITKYGIGNQANPTYENWIGNIGEIIIFNTALTTSQRQQVEGYLAWKWGLQNNLPDTHAYKKIKP